MGTVLPLQELKKVRESFRAQKKVVVFTNGCFDIIHRGHIEYLSSAKSMGDVLLVGINTDQSVHRIKGEKRPIMPEADRAFIVANLTPVDYVCLFNEATPFELIRHLIPDVLVKGGDWNRNDVVGKDIVEQAGGRVATIPFVSNCSTSTIIDQIIKQFS